ncbi:MAG: hypothetical protein BGN88_00195 [Clostridiales bacterium 43-6]|nr:MAG: hypothetical protein BGN88_00195 [Clostridiales bacterium 43-6]
MEYIGIYLGIVSLMSVFFTQYDKNAAKKHKRRVRERTLLLISALGGSVVMFLTMLAIRHKTKHAKFMIGIPVIILLQTAVIAGMIWLWLKS